MSEIRVASQIAAAIRGRSGFLLAVLPGLVMTALHATMLVVPKADFVDALDSDRYRVQWIAGAYIVGSAAGMAMTRFLGSRLGLRRAFLVGVLCFTLGATVCAGLSAVIWMTPVRCLQGYGNGLIISVGMVLVWRAFPHDKGLAMALYAMANFTPQLAGAALGGLLTTLLSWRLMFFMMLPLGCVAGFTAWRFLPHDESADEAPASLDLIGLALLLSWIVTMSVVLDMGQYWGWLASPDFVPWFAAFVVCLAGFIAWGTLAPRPLIDLRALAVRHFALGVGIKVLFTVNLVVLIRMLANYMVNLRGYQWWQAALVMAPALATMVLGIATGVLLGTNGNRKVRMALGLVLMAGATAAFATVDLYTAKGVQAAYMALWGAGAGLLVGPALLTTFEGLTTEQTLRSAGIFNILRVLPTFAIGAVLTVLLTRATDAQFDVLRQTIRYNRPIVAEAYRQPERHFTARGSPQALVGNQAQATLSRWVQANARAFALQGIFEYLALVPAVGLVLVLLVRVPNEARARPQH
jgi:MFS transporter, DHA2 family, multidrug resistance protein